MLSRYGFGAADVLIDNLPIPKYQKSQLKKLATINYPQSQAKTLGPVIGRYYSKGHLVLKLGSGKRFDTVSGRLF